MAQKANKNRAKSNAAALNNLHLGSLGVNLVFLLWHFFISSRSLTLFLVLSVPSFLCEFMLEKAGRPKFGANGALLSAGDDLNNPGLTEYMFDVVWITWGSAVLVMFLGNWAWILWSVVPAFALYKGSALLGMARNMAGMGAMQQGGQAMEAPAGNRKQRRAA